MSKITIQTLRQMKQDGEKFTSLTVYDYSFASVLDKAGIEILLVGDSLGMVIQGRDSTLPVSLRDMVYHVRAVKRGAARSLILADMPFGSSQMGPKPTLKNAAALMKAGAAAVKLEGGSVMVKTVRYLVRRGVPVCAHLGLLPQSVNQLGGYRVQGRSDDDASRIREDALRMQDAGAFAVLLEAVPAPLARHITQALDVPTIGIGAGPDCDAQVLVLQDVLGIYPGGSPKFSKNFLAGAGTVQAAVEAYAKAVRSGEFPAAEHSFS